MTGQVGQFQPGGQGPRDIAAWKTREFGIRQWIWILGALALLVAPFNRGGLLDPQELRVAELARRLAHQWFGTGLGTLGAGASQRVTSGQLGQGELNVTSPALGFALFGVEDWSGRITSVFWGGVALLALWILLGRIADRVAQRIGALLLVSLPLFGWQSRMMLGDAATVGTFALATSGLALALLDPIPVGIPSRLGRQAFYWGMGLSGMLSGILCRGIIIGIAVPALSVGLVTLASSQWTKSGVSRRLISGWLVALGLVAAGVGIRELLGSPDGFSFLLGATLSPVATIGPFDLAFTRLLHQLFPLSAFLPSACAIAIQPVCRADARREPEHLLAIALTLSCLLCVAASAMMSMRGVIMPLPALTAVAGISGLAVARMHREKARLALVGGLVLSLSVILFADFGNFPEKASLLTGVSDLPFPEAFRNEGQRWLRLVVGVLVVGCVAFMIAAGTSRTREPDLGDRYRDIVARLRAAFSGQLMSGMVLVETALVTTALLQRAHDQGWISVPAFDAMRSLGGPILTWAWILPPILLFVLPVTYVTLQAIIRWLSIDAWAPGGAAFLVAGKRGTQNLGQTLEISSALILGGTLVLAGLVVSLGHAPAMAEQLSPKRPILQYRAHARPGEPLALVGINPESAAFYLDSVPDGFRDLETAARWLQESAGQRRWLSLRVDRLAELNAAFRFVSGGHNLILVDPISGQVTVATNQLLPSERNHNPLNSDVLSRIPTVANHCDFQFGNAIRLLGWDLVSTAGESVRQLNAGTSYELKLVFEVSGTTDSDWELFVHIDGNGKRHNGDHAPVSGRYPTSLWQPGDVIIDRHKIVLERGALPGAHVVYMGLFRGNKRLEVTRGLHEDDRVSLGDIQVQ